MQNHDPGMWAFIAAWLYTSKDQISYAMIAAMFSLIRSFYGTTRWQKRLLDAVSCSALAYFSAPLLDVFARFFHLELSDSAPTVAAIFIGYVGNDFIRDFVN
ncbi:phage holin, lambda family, partial [Salmonella enterica subsp. enterica]|nr:phage holin, lambda family [Salmonella enterica subsp. enterica]